MSTLVAVPISPFCLACGWDLGANTAKVIDAKRTPSDKCSSCGVDLNNFERALSVDQSAFIVPPIVTDIEAQAEAVVFTYTENPQATTEEFISRVNGGAFTAPALATGGFTSVPGTAGQVLDYRIRSVGTDVDGPFSPVATGVVSA